jgi:hypothetical protein
MRSVSSPAHPGVTISNTFKGLAVATVAALAIAAPARGAPAGSEYIPQVPSATGSNPVSGGFAGGGGATGPSASGEKAAKKSEADKDKAGDEKSAAVPLVGDGGSGDGDGSSGILDSFLDPIALLRIAGVLAIAAGMTTAVRQGGSSPQLPHPRRLLAAAPPTPDGEIIAGDDGPH